MELGLTVCWCAFFPEHRVMLLFLSYSVEKGAEGKRCLMTVALATFLLSPLHPNPAFV